MTLTREQVEHVAKLARLRLTEDELELYGRQLSSILGYVEILLELDVAAVEPSFHVLGVAAPLRPDIPEPTGTVDDALANAPAKLGTSFLVPKVIES